MEPEAKVIFGFQKDADVSDGSDLLKSPRFTKHAQYFIQMIDKALGLLGPDLELLTDILVRPHKQDAIIKAILLCVVVYCVICDVPVAFNVSAR